MYKKFAITALALTLSYIFVPKALAAVYDRDKLAHALALRFNLNEKDVTYFLADFQYDPDKTMDSLTKPPIVASTPIPNSTTHIQTSTPTPSPSTLPTTIPTVTINGLNYSFDPYTDAYYPATQIVSTQHQNHLNFIKQKIDIEVKAGRINPEQEVILMDKLAQMMQKSPSSAEFAKMNTKERASALKIYKREMSDFLERRGMSLDELQSITGKGAQYLMGIYLE